MIPIDMMAAQPLILMNFRDHRIVAWQARDLKGFVVKTLAFVRLVS